MQKLLSAIGEFLRKADMLLLGLCIILMVLFQSGKSEGLGVIGGAADTFLAKSKAKSMDAKLARATKWVGAAFIVLTLVLSIMQ